MDFGSTYRVWQRRRAFLLARIGSYCSGCEAHRERRFVRLHSPVLSFQHWTRVRRIVERKHHAVGFHHKVACSYEISDHHACPHGFTNFASPLIWKYRAEFKRLRLSLRIFVLQERTRLCSRMHRAAHSWVQFMGRLR